MSWRIYLWIVGVIIALTHAPSFIEPSSPGLAMLAVAMVEPVSGPPGGAMLR